jgi:hypothetical protein
MSEKEDMENELECRDCGSKDFSKCFCYNQKCPVLVYIECRECEYETITLPKGMHRVCRGKYDAFCSEKCEFEYNIARNIANKQRVEEILKLKISQYD